MLKIIEWMTYDKIAHRAGGAETGRPISPGMNVSYMRTEWGCRSDRPRACFQGQLL